MALLLAVGLTAVVAISLTRAQQDDPLDPLRVAADTHKLAFENAFLRVLEVQLPPGKSEPRHRHPHGLSIYFTDWQSKATADGGQPSVGRRTAGSFVWNDAVIHTVENVGTTEARILRVELKF
jgi:quercetin dioxygenase-like cupin family protein